MSNIKKLRRSNSKDKNHMIFSTKQLSPSRSISPNSWANRYRELHHQYVDLLEQVKDKQHMYQMQQKQIIRLRQEKIRDYEQIQKLRSLLGFLKRQDKSIQCIIQKQSLQMFEREQLLKQATKTQNKFDHRTNYELSNYIATDYNNSPKRQRSYSPKYDKLRYNLTQSPRNISENGNILGKTQKTCKKKNKISQMMIGQQERQFRTQSLHDERQRTATVYKTVYKNIDEKQCKINKDNKQLDSGSSRQLFDKTQNNELRKKLSNSPYSKLRFLKNKI